MSKLQERPSALKGEHPALQNLKFLNFLFIFVGHFRPSGLGSGSETLEYRRIKFKIQKILRVFGSGMFP
jgi:hypothetical protein